MSNELNSFTNDRIALCNLIDMKKIDIDVNSIKNESQAQNQTEVHLLLSSMC